MKINWVEITPRGPWVANGTWYRLEVERISPVSYEFWVTVGSTSQTHCAQTFEAAKSAAESILVQIGRQIAEEAAV